MCVLTAELLKNMKQFIEDGVHPQVIVKAFRLANAVAQKKITDLAVTLEGEAGADETLLRCAATALNSKLISGQKVCFRDSLSV